MTITEEDGLPVRNVRDLELYESLLNRKAIPAYDGTLVTVRADGGNINLAEVEEFTEIEIEDEPQEEVQERAEETNNDNEHADDNGAVVDYTKYKEIIAEMKGEN